MDYFTLHDNKVSVLVIVGTVIYVVSEVIGKLHIQSLSNEEMLGTSGWTNPNPLSQHWFNINEAKSLIIHLAEKVVILTQTFKPVFALL